jgi:hypothetical protein
VGGQGRHGESGGVLTREWEVAEKWHDSGGNLLVSMRKARKEQ